MFVYDENSDQSQATGANSNSKLENIENKGVK